MKEPWKLDVPVYMIFFNRPDTLALVFESVRQAKPSKLFLACDGPREGREDDIENVKKCQEIVENIDWDCEVYKNYSTENLGCGMRMYSGISWAFEYVDRLIIIEDDCVLAQDYYRFAEELLEKYKDDERIFRINAMNHLGKYENTPNSYFFSGGCCWGWATWKRAWKNMDFEMSFMEDEYYVKCVEKKYPYYSDARKKCSRALEVLKNGKKLSFWAYQGDISAALNDQIAITPCVNLVTNVGLTANSEHAVDNIRKLSKRTQGYFNAPTYEMKFPLKHPKYVIEDRMYRELLDKKFKDTVFSRIEGIVRRIIFAEKGDISAMIKKIPKKLKLTK